VFKNIYWSLFLIPLGLTLIGVAFIYSASASLEINYAVKQLFWLFWGILLMMIVMIRGYKFFVDTSYLLYAVSILLLIAVWIVGAEKSGAQRWLEFGFFQLQPSELCKLATILALAKFLGNRKISERQLLTVAVSFLLVLVPLVLIVMQPDLGTALIFVPILFCMIYLWGSRLRYLLVPFFFWHS